MKNIEIWKDVKNYEGIYQISNLGRIKSLKRVVVGHFYRGNTHIMPEKILATSKSKYGYIQVVLCKNNKQKLHLIHRLVAEAFIPNPENKRTVNHKNGKKDDNNVNNLEWATYSENVKHAFENKLNVPAWKNKFGKLHSTSKKVEQYDMNNNFIKRWDCITDASRELGIDCSCIIRCCKGKTKYSKGYIWKYVMNKSIIERRK